MNKIAKALTLISVTSLVAGIGILVAKKIYYNMNIKSILDRNELKSLPRKINKVVIHCSATRLSQKCDVATIDRWHRQVGMNGIGYHYVIYLDGTIRKGRDIAITGAHTKGHNTDSIGICYIGGLDNSGKAYDTRTPQQKTSLQAMISELKLIYPNITVHGHREFTNKACPCFDVRTEL